MKNNNKIHITEATGDSSGARGSYIAPLQPGIRVFKKSELGPFTERVSNYDSPELEYDSYDGSMNKTKKQIKKIESKAKKVTNYIKKHPNSTFSDDEGNNINQTPGKKKKIVPIVREWYEITEDTILEDIVSDEPKPTSNYEKVIDNFRGDIPKNKIKIYNLISKKIKDFIIEKGYSLKILNACNTGFRGVRTNKGVIICSPQSFSNFAIFVYVLFHELRHEQQMGEFNLSDSYLGDIEDFEEMYKMYWDMELDADRYAKEWVEKIGKVLDLPEDVYHLDSMIKSYPSQSNMVRHMMEPLHREIQRLKKQGMSYTDISDLDIVKKHLHKLENMF